MKNIKKINWNGHWDDLENPLRTYPEDLLELLLAELKKISKENGNYARKPLSSK